jgi:hypothetical protein
MKPKKRKPDPFWIKKTDVGFEVYRTGLVISTRVYVNGYKGIKGLRRALVFLKGAERRRGFEKVW